MIRTAEKNLKLLNILSFLDSFKTFDAVIAIYFSQVTGSFASVMFVLSLVNLSASFFEVPTGLFSDNIGRKKTMLIHYFGGAIAISLYFLAQSTFVLAIGAIILGFALAMSSGAIQAYVYENVKILNNDKDYKKYEGSRRSIEKFSMVFAAIIGTVIIKYYGIRPALLLTILTRSISFVIGFKLEDVAENRKISSNIYSQIKDAWGYFSSSYVIRDIGIARIIFLGGGNVEFRLKSLFFKTLVPDWMVSLIGILNSLISAIVMKYTEKIVSKFGFMKSLVLGEFLNRASTSVLIFINSTVTPFAIAVVGGTAFGIREVASEDILQEKYSPSQRATMGSLIGFASSLFYSILGVIAGFIADKIGLTYTLLAIEMILLTSVFFSWRTIKNNNK